MPAPLLGPIGELAAHARIYAQAGLEIFPADPRSKAPLVDKGFYDATVDLEQINAWWTRWPGALIAHRIAPGQLLLDVDPRHGGIETWLAIKAAIGGELPVTRIHRSGRGDLGMHFWWLRPGERVSTRALDQWAKDHGVGHQLEARWTCGIDILHNTCRYSILPPSPHPDSGQPYRWHEHRGFDIAPAPLPAYIADLLVIDEPAPTTWTPTPADPDSIADWYSTHHNFADVLRPHGWNIVAGDGNHDGSRWRHPDATSSMSATIRHGCLFVYSTSTPFEPTVPGDPHGYTPFHAYAVLNHGGDQSAAAKAARDIKDPTPADTLSWIQTAHGDDGGRTSNTAEPTQETQRDPDIHAVIAAAPVEYDWLIENLIERGDRTIITGPEGGGKTTLLRQVAILAASGIHPFTEEPITPVRTLYVDLENSIRQTVRHFSPLVIQAGAELGTDMLIPVIRPEGLDLLKTPDCAWLAERINVNDPALLVIGPLYKLALGDPTSEEIARHVAYALDAIRTHYGIAIIIEAHQPHRSNGHRPDRPYGASLWMRWPEFGLSLTPEGFVNHWRGPRDEREWPAVLRRGGNWPWTPATAVYAHFATLMAACREAGDILSVRDLEKTTGIPKTTVQRAIDANRGQWEQLTAELGAPE